jgi:uncharacterized protein GlcG (DUF336 family)
MRASQHCHDLVHRRERGIAQQGQQGSRVNTANRCRVVIFGGGVPVTVDGKMIGAAGASGGSVEQDIEVARAAVAGLKLS